ncbi:GGDEF domain-containing protein [Gorillibacterium sp. CAU 1737]|uniref:GGDEF domain-containing protein n=1 Tax=Gorillibacterium sp. CAU 1737 TaxID=3140362 RepID=UPI003260E64A
MKRTLKAALPALIPLLFLLAAYAFLQKSDTLTEPQLDLLQAAPYAVLAIGCIIAWKFHHSREFFILLLLGACLFLLSGGGWLASRQPDWKPDPRAVFLLVSLAIPLNAALFSLFRERGIGSVWGLSRLTLLAAQAGAIIWLSRAHHTEWLERWQERLHPFGEKLTGSTAFSQAALAAFGLAALVLLLRFRSRKSPAEFAHLALLAALLYTLRSGNEDSLLLAVGFGLSGLLLIASILQDSYSMAFTDELTGLPSRRALKQDLLKLGFSYSIAMLDIDFFKKFNDTHGHDTGDDVLKLVASVIRHVPGGGKAYRYGGEEFTVVFKNKSAAEAIPHLEELRETVSKRGFTVRSKPRSTRKRKGRSGAARAARELFVTVSIGVSNRSETAKTPDAVMKEADKALYRAKKKGRNCVSK